MLYILTCVSHLICSTLFSRIISPISKQRLIPQINDWTIENTSRKLYRFTSFYNLQIAFISWTLMFYSNLFCFSLFLSRGQYVLKKKPDFTWWHVIKHAVYCPTLFLLFWGQKYCSFVLLLLSFLLLLMLLPLFVMKCQKAF